MSKWIAEFELEDGDTMPEHMDLEYKGVRIDFHCKPLEQEPTYCPKFRNQQEKNRVFHTVTAVENFFSLIGNDYAIDNISVLKELVRNIEVEE